MPNMTFQEEGDYIVCYIDNVEVSRAKKAADGTSTADVINIINDQIKANPTLSGTEPNLEGLEVSGNKYAVPQGSGGSLMSDIVDANGNHRFVEGAGNLGTIANFTFTYNKWSLSGTHLMLVLAGTVSSGGIANIGTTFVSYELPEWILNKIIPLTDTEMVSVGDVTYYLISSGNYFDSKSIILKKESNALSIVSNQGGSITNNVSFRIQFDLLIDAS